jgi:hypothetical protein
MIRPDSRLLCNFLRKITQELHRLAGHATPRIGRAISDIVHPLAAQVAPLALLLDYNRSVTA